MYRLKMLILLFKLMVFCFCCGQSSPAELIRVLLNIASILDSKHVLRFKKGQILRVIDKHEEKIQSLDVWVVLLFLFFAK